MSMIMHSIMRYPKPKNKHQLRPKQEHHHAWQHVHTQQVQQHSDRMVLCTLTMRSLSLIRSMRSKSIKSINIATRLPHGQRAA